MMSDKAQRLLKSAARWLQRRAKKRANPDTKAAYKEAIEIIGRLCVPKVTKPRPAPKPAMPATSEGE